jgi:DNA-binding NarL/FixJ family response regulator
VDHQPTTIRKGPPRGQARQHHGDTLFFKGRFSTHAVHGSRQHGFRHWGAAQIAYLLDEHLPNMETILLALQQVRAGQTVLDRSIVDTLVRRHEGLLIDDLTIRELGVLEFLTHGLSNRGIAAELSLSVKDIERYITTIFRKLKLDNGGRPDRRVSAALAFQRA